MQAIPRITPAPGSSRTDRNSINPPPCSSPSTPCAGGFFPGTESGAWLTICMYGIETLKFCARLACHTRRTLVRKKDPRLP